MSYTKADLKTLFEEAKAEKELLKQKLRVSEEDNEKLQQRIDTIAEEQTHVQKELHRLTVKESVSDENILQLQQELLAVTEIADKCEWKLEMVRRTMLRAKEEVRKELNDVDKKELESCDELITPLKEISRLEAQPEKISSVHVEQDSSKIQENPIILIGETGDIPDGGLQLLRLPTLPKFSVADLDKNDDYTGPERLKSVLKSKSDQEEFELLLMEKAEQVYELLLLKFETCFLDAIEAPQSRLNLVCQEDLHSSCDEN